jgi:hypothetical protein
MSSRLKIVIATISIVGSSVVASGALAHPYHAAAHPYRAAGEARYFSGAYARYAAVGELDQSGYGFGDDVSKPRYQGGPKAPY